MVSAIKLMCSYNAQNKKPTIVGARHHQLVRKKWDDLEMITSNAIRRRLEWLEHLAHMPKYPMMLSPRSIWVAAENLPSKRISQKMA